MGQSKVHFTVGSNNDDNAFFTLVVCKCLLFVQKGLIHKKD